MSTTVKAGVLVCLLAIASGSAGGATLATHRLGREQGLPSAQVHAAVQGPDGFVWLATPLGLARYDGARVKLLGPADGLSSHGLRFLTNGNDGTLWIGTDAGVDIRDRSGRIRPLVDAASWRFGFVDDIAPGVDGATWLATPKGLVEWHPSRGAKVDDRLPPDLVSAVEQVGDVVWAAAATWGLRYLTADGWQAPSDERWREIGPVSALAAGAEGSILVGGAGGLVELSSDGVLRRRIDGESLRDRISAILTFDDELWVGVGGELRLYRQTDAGWQAAAVLGSVQVNDLSADVQGNVWIATESSGVEKVSILRRAVSTLDPPCATQVYSVSRAPGGGFLVGGDQCSWRMDRRGRALERLSGLDRTKVWDLLEARSGSLWAATESGLFQRQPGAPWRQVGAGTPVLAAPGRSLLERGDEIWVGTLAGLGVVSVDGAVSQVTDPGGAALGYVYTLVEDLEGRLWVGTIGNGLWRGTERAVVERIRTDHLTPRGNVYSVAVSPDGSVAVLQDDRIVLLSGRGSRLIPSASGETVAGWSALFGGRGDLWVGSTSGLREYDLETGGALRHLSSANGLAGDEFTTSRSLIASGDGRLFCGLDAGLSVVDLEALETLKDLPEVRLSEVLWRDAEVKQEEGTARVRYGKWTLDVFLSAPWFVDEGRLLYRHRLRGFDAGWSASRSSASLPARYTGLPPGRYVLEAQTYSPLVGWGPVEEVFAIEVAWPWWGRGWMLPVWIALAGGLVLGSWKWRTRILVERASELEALVEERTEALHRANLELERRASRSEERYRLLFDSVQAAVVLYDLDERRIVDVNDAAVRLYGYSRDEMCALRDPALFIGSEMSVAIFRKLLAGDDVGVFLDRHLKKDGTVFPVEVSAGVFHQGGHRMMYGVVRDVTKRQQAEEVRERLIKELENKNTQLERFTYTVSHDLKSPLVTIRGFVGYLERDALAGDVERLRRDARRIRDATETMGHLLDDLLELSRIGRVVRTSEEVSFGDLARDAVELAAGEIAERGVTVEIAPGSPVVFGDRMRLLQALQNLVSNAVKFMGEQTDPRIEIGAREDGPFIVCYVKDNGIGIDPRYHEKVFDLFDRLDASRQGTGIGLTLVKRIVETHGGRVWIESVGEGKGSAFVFTLRRGV